MLADQLDYVVGVDPHRDSHALAVVHVFSGAVVLETTVAASSDGYAQALKLVEVHASGRRAFAVEGAGSFGAGLTRFLTGRGERVLEVSRLRRERRSGGKTDALDAIRAARSVLGQERSATPRAGGERQALQALVAAREGAVNAKCAALGQLRDLLVTTPEPLRGELRLLTPAPLLKRLAATRPDHRRDPELRGTMLALRSIARRVLQVTAEERELAREIETIIRKLAPQLLDQPGVGPHSAAQIVLSWSHRGRISSEAAFARLARRSTDPGFLWADSPLPPRPKRRPKTQPRTAHDPRHTQTRTPRHDRLHRTAHPRRQDPTRSNPLPQALPRPKSVPATRTGSTAGDLTNIEASLAQWSAIASGLRLAVLTAQDLFRAMMRDQVAPALRKLGFKGSGQSYLLPCETHWALLSFQKSIYSDANEIRFAVNFDVTTKKEWEHRRRAFGAPERPTPSWLSRHSIADPGKAGGLIQHWWHLRVKDSIRPLVDDVLSRIEHEAVPSMRALIDEHSS